MSIKSYWKKTQWSELTRGEKLATGGIIVGIYAAQYLAMRAIVKTSERLTAEMREESERFAQTHAKGFKLVDTGYEDDQGPIVIEGREGMSLVAVYVPKEFEDAVYNHGYPAPIRGTISVVAGGAALELMDPKIPNIPRFLDGTPRRDDDPVHPQNS